MYYFCIIFIHVFQVQPNVYFSIFVLIYHQRDRKYSCVQFWCIKSRDSCIIFVLVSSSNYCNSYHFVCTGIKLLLSSRSCAEFRKFWKSSTLIPHDHFCCSRLIRENMLNVWYAKHTIINLNICLPQSLIFYLNMLNGDVNISCLICANKYLYVYYSH